MGCDGGTIPTRDELVKLKKKPEKIERDVNLAAKWKHCALSQQLLANPIVACELGRLYNKDVIIELLLDRSKFEDPAKVEHIRGLKDIKELQLTKNPAYKAGDDKAETYVSRAAEFICPITGLEMTGSYQFQMIWSCGCVFAKRALKEIQSINCNKCGKAYISSDVITLNADAEELEEQRVTMMIRRAQAKLDKKAKKKKASEAAGSSSDVPASKKSKLSPDTHTNDSSSDSKSSDSTKTNGTQSLTTDATDKLKKSDKKEKGERKDKKEKREKKEKKYKSLQDDPKTSAAYKSLFSSSSEAKSKGSAHWVTHNPFYN